MKLVLGSDLHGHLPEIPPCDVLVLAGDILPDNNQVHFAVTKLGPWLRRAPARHVVATWGNHDWLTFIKGGGAIELPWILLIDQSVRIDGLLFYGTPWCRPTDSKKKWAWQAPESSLKKIYAAIPDDTDVLISHTPPFCMRDRCDDGDRAGSKMLRKRLEQLPNLKLLICGHIHEARGQEGVVYNVSCVKRKYKPERTYKLYDGPWTEVEL